MYGWRVNPAAVDVSISHGAGQFRAVGRSVAMYNASKIHREIDERLSKLNKYDIAQLHEIEEAITGVSPDGAEKPGLHVFVISSLAGGSGAGMLLEVCDIIRAINPAIGQELFGILYTPEVFESLGPGVTGGVQANALAAISEILNGYWYGGDNNIMNDASSVPPISDAVLESVGLSNSIVNSGPAYPFLIGRVNQQGIDHGRPERLFEIVAKSLSSMLTSPAAYSKFVAYVIGNWQQYKDDRHSATESDVLVNRGRKEEQGHPVFSSFGYARLSVGLDYFKEYTIQRILKANYAHLTRYHYESPEAKVIAKDKDEKNPVEGFNWQFALIESETKNAWCMPGGKIAFYTGILPVCKNDDGIAAVMGHEIAHAFARHTVEKLTQASMMQMATIGISRSKYAELLNKSFRVGNVGGNVYNSVVKYGIFLPFSRKMESEADYLGMGFMNLAGFNIKEPAKLWQRMMAGQEGRVPEFMGSHPSPDNRSKKFLEWESEIIDKFPQV